VTVSAIPPSVIGSVLGSPAAQIEQTRSSDASKNVQADAARKLAGGTADILEVEATDADTQVHTDSGGAGSQGRLDAPPEEENEQTSDQQPGVVVDDKGVPHLDVSA
jgi:hypothetical protein